MSRISIVFRKDKKNKAEKAPINIRITKRGKVRYFPTGFSIYENDWDFEKNLIKSSFRNSIAQLPMNEQKEILKSALNNWKGNLEQVDDICVIGVRV